MQGILLRRRESFGYDFDCLIQSTSEWWWTQSSGRKRVVVELKVGSCNFCNRELERGGGGGNTPISVYFKCCSWTLLPVAWGL